MEYPRFIKKLYITMDENTSGQAISPKPRESRGYRKNTFFLKKVYYFT